MTRRQTRILNQFHKSGATVEDLARAWASMDGKRDKFDAEKDKPASEAIYGHYLGYLTEAEEVLTRATKYANERQYGTKG